MLLRLQWHASFGIWSIMSFRARLSTAKETKRMNISLYTANCLSRTLRSDRCSSRSTAELSPSMSANDAVESQTYYSFQNGQWVSSEDCRPTPSSSSPPSTLKLITWNIDSYNEDGSIRMGAALEYIEEQL